MVYQVGDIVLYSSHGVCKVVEIVERDLSGNRIKYYVLKPIYDNNSTVFIPVNSEALTSKMRDVLSLDEVQVLIEEIPNKTTIWIDNENARRDRYKEIVAGGNRTELVQLIKTLYQTQQVQRESGKKLHLSDERFMKDAEKMLYEELAHVLDIECSQVLEFVLPKMITVNKEEEEVV
jgi:Transcriptional regulators, similar to M. xanthus CarD